MNQEALFVIESPWGSGPMPLSWFSEDERSEFTRLAASPKPPRKWMRVGPGAEIISRAWYEWHWRRGHDPDKAREPIPAALRRAVLKRDGYVCGLCGAPVESGDVHLDHRQPVSRGGKTTLDNLQVAHSFCNLSKGHRE